jgi:hypothetical protein
MIETNKQFEKRIRSYGVGGFWGRGIRLFDEHFEALPTIQEYDGMVKIAMQKLASEGFVPQEDYAEDGADCDNWAMMIYVEVMKQWIKKHEGSKSYPALEFGWDIMKGHANNIALSEKEVGIWNYGQLVSVDPATIIEVSFG